MINLYLHSTMYLFQLSYLFIDEAGSEIYIPLCIYFNHQPYNQHTSEDNLHSTMYLFQRLQLRRNLRHNRNLHSTMYLFQPDPAKW